MTSELNFEAMPFEYRGEGPQPFSNANAAESEEFEKGSHHHGGSHHHHHRRRHRFGAPYWPASSFPIDASPFDDGGDDDSQPPSDSAGDFEAEAEAEYRHRRDRSNWRRQHHGRGRHDSGQQSFPFGGLPFGAFDDSQSPDGSGFELEGEVRVRDHRRGGAYRGHVGAAASPWRERIWRTGAAPQWRQRGYFGAPSYGATGHRRHWDGVGDPYWGRRWNIPNAVHWPHYARGRRWWPAAVPQEPYGAPSGPDIGAPEPSSFGAGAGPTEYMRWAQAALNDLLGLQLPTNGIADAATRSAIRTFQQQNGLPADGVIGPDTERALVAARAAGSPSSGTMPSAPDMAGPPPSGAPPAAPPPAPDPTAAAGAPPSPMPASTPGAPSTPEFDLEWDTDQSRIPMYRDPPGKVISLSTECETPALKAIQLLNPKIVSCMTVEVPTERVKWLLNHSLAERGPNWVKQLTVDVTTKFPSVEVTIELFRFIAVRPDDPVVAKELSKYMAAKGLTYYTSLLIELKISKEIQDNLRVSLDHLYKQAGVVLGKLPPDEYRRYVLFVYAKFPDTVKQFVRPYGTYIVNRFAFDKSSLQPFHLPIIRTIARDIVDSWWTGRKVIGIDFRGHTDDSGTDDHNYDLGQRRATTVQQQLKNELGKISTADMQLDFNKIRINIGSLGKDEPASKTDRALNRRVEVLFTYSAERRPESLSMGQVTSRCIELLRKQQSLSKDDAQRLLCVMGKMRNSDVDDRINDRFATSDVIGNIDRTNRPVEPDQWPRLRYSLSNPSFYGPKVSDAQVLKNLQTLNRWVIDGILLHRKLVNYYSGVPVVGALSTGKTFRAFDAWINKQFKDELSVYSCYRNI